MTILVTGGTGVLGRRGVDRLVVAGHRVRVLSRDPSRSSTVHGAELCAGNCRHRARLRAALSDVQTVVHCASDVRSPDDIDVAGTSNPLTLHDLVATWLSATDRRRRILLPVAFPGAAGWAFKDGANLCPGQSSAGPTWTQYLQGSHSPEGAVK